VKSASKAQSATSLPEAPRDDEHRRSSRYLIMMGIRVLCFILMVVVTPYSWYTWVFAAGAILIPYIAVVLANAGSDVSRSTTAVNPERALPAAPSPRPAPPASGPEVLRIEETRTIAPRRGDSDANA
jgi:small-conductance mechanosensitive channel